jgi:hypothetical protein
MNNYAKILEDGKVQTPKPVRSVSEDGLTVTYTSKSVAELEADGFKKVYSHMSGKPFKGAKPVTSYEDKGEYILKTISWK